MEQIGVVENKKGNKVEVTIRRISGCGGNCGSCGGCDAPTSTLLLKNDLNAEVGDMVKVQAQAKTMLKYTMLIYGIPLVMLLVGVFGSTGFLKSKGLANYEVLSFIIGLAFMSLGLLVVRLMDKKVAREGNDTVKIIEIL